MHSLSHLLAFQLPVRLAIGSYCERFGAIVVTQNVIRPLEAIGSYWQHVREQCCRVELRGRSYVRSTKKQSQKQGDFFVDNQIIFDHLLAALCY